MLLDLLSNAADSMPVGAAEQNELRIRTALDEDGTHVLRCVQDSGRGIEPQALEHIFEPFFTTRPPGEGRRLGLSVARNPVEKMGGTIEVGSEVGVGTTVAVALSAGSMR